VATGHIFLELCDLFQLALTELFIEYTICFAGFGAALDKWSPLEAHLVSRLRKISVSFDNALMNFHLFCI
jgi:hypothetical protein